jgi:hypothetical protein
MKNEKKRPAITWNTKPNSVREMLAALQECDEFEAKHGMLHIYENPIVTRKLMLDICLRITSLQKKRLK